MIRSLWDRGEKRLIPFWYDWAYVHHRSQAQQEITGRQYRAWIYIKESEEPFMIEGDTEQEVRDSLGKVLSDFYGKHFQ